MIPYQTTGYPMTPDPYRSGIRNMSGQDSRGGIPGMSNMNSGSATGGSGPQWWQGSNAASGYPAPSTGMPNTGSPGPQMSPGLPQFGKDNNLISTQFNPTASDRTKTAQGATDMAKQNYANSVPSTGQSKAAFEKAGALMDQQQAFDYKPVAGTDLSGARKYLDMAGASLGPSSAAYFGGGGGGIGYSGDTQKLREMTMAQLQKMSGGAPDRAALADSTFQRLVQAGNPAYEQELRQANQRNAAMGRAGSGMSTQDLGTVQQRREEALARERAALADQAAGLTLSDQNDILNAQRGVLGDFGGMDVNMGQLSLSAMNSANAAANQRFGSIMDLADAEGRLAGITRNDALGERDAERQSYLDRNNVLQSRAGGIRNMGMDLTDLGQTDFGNRRNLFNDFSADEQRLTGNDRADRQELRGERDYQYGLSRDAQQDSLNERMMQEELLNSRFRRGQGAFNSGYSTDPTQMLGQQATGYSNDAASSYGAMGDLFGTYATRGAQPSAQRAAQRKVAFDPFNVPDYTAPEFQVPETRWGGSY